MNSIASTIKLHEVITSRLVELDIDTDTRADIVTYRGMTGGTPVLVDLHENWILVIAYDDEIEEEISSLSILRERGGVAAATANLRLRNELDRITQLALQR